jgi:hypothetical protein
VAPSPRDAGTFPQLGAPHGPAFGRLPSDPPTWSAGLPPLSGTDLLTLDRDYERRVEAVQSLDRLVRHVGHVLHGGPAVDNTYVVVSSSGGYHDGEHRLLPGSGTAFDTDIRVPLVLRGPAVVANATVDAMASSVDLAPTFEAIAGARPSGVPDGSSLCRCCTARCRPAGSRPSSSNNGFRRPNRGAPVPRPDSPPCGQQTAPMSTTPATEPSTTTSPTTRTRCTTSPAAPQRESSPTSARR